MLRTCRPNFAEVADTTWEVERAWETSLLTLQRTQSVRVMKKSRYMAFREIFLDYLSDYRFRKTCSMEFGKELKTYNNV
jgi:hypothetical protein